jgi:hypothetical protein
MGTQFQFHEWKINIIFKSLYILVWLEQPFVSKFQLAMFAQAPT